MKTLLLVLLIIIAVILTIWLLVIPAEVVVGFFKALGHGEWRGWRRDKPR
ncbi:hypothetical protein M1B72_20900 [Geomonas paludis]|uniref:Uncharacterized protein n=1 Tax=Geomonas paludis TaxID=2740185 RepID=A0A6V8MS27_9BACT|nr:hypothetical protein [Geomonas paludis]UPU35869.1 hypothetical protein M1B72_20900 [Geomonas paludis]GFO62547.1 hypothetical protein GMPD_04660 [Geomonas paludis]